MKGILKITLSISIVFCSIFFVNSVSFAEDGAVLANYIVINSDCAKLISSFNSENEFSEQHSINKVGFIVKPEERLANVLKKSQTSEINFTLYFIPKKKKIWVNNVNLDNIRLDDIFSLMIRNILFQYYIIDEDLDAMIADSISSQKYNKADRSINKFFRAGRLFHSA